MKKITAMILSLVLAMALMTGVCAEEVQAVEDIFIALGETVAMNVAEAQAEGAQTVWTTSDEAIASVDAQGNVTGLNAGAAVITASVTTTVVETIEKTAYEIVRDTNAEGQLVTRRVEKIVTEQVENVVSQEIALNVEVETALCPGCAVEYTNAAEFTAHVQPEICGADGHYVCDAIEDHETILDAFCQNENPHRVCQAGAAFHDCASCGETYACEDSGNHAACIACGNAWCFKDNGNHSTPCGRENHRPCVMEGYNKKDHYRCDYCGDLRCDGDRHGRGKCVAE